MSLIEKFEALPSRSIRPSVFILVFKNMTNHQILTLPVAAYTFDDALQSVRSDLMNERYGPGMFTILSSTNFDLPKLIIGFETFLATSTPPTEKQDGVALLSDKNKLMKTIIDGNDVTLYVTELAKGTFTKEEEVFLRERLNLDR